MACPELDDLLNGAAQGHAELCENCRVLLEAWADADATLETAFAGLHAPPSVAAAARMTIDRQAALRAPSFLPEILDFIGWAAVLGLAAALIPRFFPWIDAALAKLSGPL